MPLCVAIDTFHRETFFCTFFRKVQRFHAERKIFFKITGPDAVEFWAKSETFLSKTIVLAFECQPIQLNQVNAFGKSRFSVVFPANFPFGMELLSVSLCSGESTRIKFNQILQIIISFSFRFLRFVFFKPILKSHRKYRINSRAHTIECHAFR